MTVGARRFTPEVLLSAPRRSTATPSPDGTAALFSVSTYSFQTHKKSSEIRVLDINTGQTKILSNDLEASEPTWLGQDDVVLLLKGGEKGTTSLLAVRANVPNDKYVRCCTRNNGLIDIVPNSS
jgi:Tol biopolymer transport system component